MNNTDACIFCEIVRGTRRASVVVEDELTMVSSASTRVTRPRQTGRHEMPTRHESGRSCDEGQTRGHPAATSSILALPAGRTEAARSRPPLPPSRGGGSRTPDNGLRAVGGGRVDDGPFEAGLIAVPAQELFGKGVDCVVGDEADGAAAETGPRHA